jgi:hypothetical protein
MWKALKKSITGILGSKKFIAAIASAGVTAAMHFGIEIPLDATIAVIGPVWVAILGQGVADLGKGKAEIEAARDE